MREARGAAPNPAKGPIFGTRLLVLALLAGCAGPETQNVCALEHVASLPLLPAAGYLAVSVVIDDKPATMVVDTGAQLSMIADGQEKILGLQRDPHRTSHLIGTGGGEVTVPNALVPGIRFGDRDTGDLSLPVGSLVGPLAKLDPPVSGLIGLDVLEPYDLDIDRPHNVLGLYVRTDCETDRPEWTGRVMRLPLVRATNNLILMPIVVDGVKLQAVVDTGSRRTVISEGALARLGLDSAALAGDPPTRSEGVDATPRYGHLHRFSSFKIGTVTLHNIRLDVGSTHLATGDMLLGEDFFAHNRVWLSSSAATAFVALSHHTGSGADRTQGVQGQSC